MQQQLALEERISFVEGQLKVFETEVEHLANQTDRGAERFNHLENTVNQRFSSLEDTFNKRFISLEENFNQRFSEVAQRFTSLEDKMDRRFEVIDRRFDSMRNWLVAGFIFFTVLITVFNFI